MRKCHCGHLKNDHLWVAKSLFTPSHVPMHMVEAVVRTPQEGSGLCKKCLCPKYKPEIRFLQKPIEYPERPITNEDTEKRCTRCGHLLSNHVDVNHPFQDTR